MLGVSRAMAGEPAPRRYFDSRLASALTPLSWVYGAAARCRRAWVSRHAHCLARPVISVGNITCGGTGKTPVVEMVARDVIALGLRPAILSRGYGAPGEGQANDELQVLAANLPTVELLQGADRIATGRKAVEGGAEVILLDDGFQHMRLARDLDIVLIDALDPLGGGRVLPAGALREPLSTLARAGLLAITRADQVDPRYLGTLSTYLRLRFPRVPQARIVTAPVGWRRLSGETEAVDALRGARALAFCGIGNPETFRRALLGLGVEVVELVCFRDHHRYTTAEIEALKEEAAARGVAAVVLTQKDAVKIAPGAGTESWRVLHVEARVVGGLEAYRGAVERAVARAASPGGG